MSEIIEEIIEKIIDSKIDGLKRIMYFQMIVAANPKEYHFKTYQDVLNSYNHFNRNSLIKLVPPKE